MKKLEESITLKGVGKNVRSVQIKRSTIVRSYIYLYKRSDDVYEVFKSKILEKSIIFGKHYPKREVYPSSEDFGKTAWCYTKLVNAENKFDSLCHQK